MKNLCLSFSISNNSIYPSVVDAVKLDTRLYEMLALVDALRVGKAREKEFAIGGLKQRILDE